MSVTVIDKLLNVIREQFVIVSTERLMPGWTIVYC